MSYAVFPVRAQVVEPVRVDAFSQRGGAGAVEHGVMRAVASANVHLVVRDGVCVRVRRVCGVTCVLVLAACTVGLAPRFVGAQATQGTSMTVRHTISAQVGTVTKATLGAPRRPDASERGSVSALQSQAPGTNVWASTAAISSNVSGLLILEAAALTEVANSVDSGAPNSNGGARGWRVMNAVGQLVPWSGEPIAVSAPFAAGRHELVIMWVAPEGEGAPPSMSVRVSPI